MEKVNLVKRLSNNFTKIIPRDECSKHKEINWGNNGVGNRWCSKMFCYSAIKAKQYTLYNDLQGKAVIDEQKIKDFQKTFIKSHNIKQGIIGIYVHYELSQQNIDDMKRPIRDEIKTNIKSQPCVNCGSTSETVCDHKNDLYNDKRVLNTNTQSEDDFQCLCNRCNLLKRQACKVEKEINKLYSAKNIPKYKVFDFDFPWEMKDCNINDPDLKKDTYWYDPIEFNNKVYLYATITIPIIKEIKRKVGKGTITKVQ
jgi:hypothetical protein